LLEKEVGTLELPAANRRIWRTLIKGEKEYDFEFLAIKIFLGRAKLVQFNDTSEKTIESLITELRALIQQNIDHPAVQRDLMKLK